MKKIRLFSVVAGFAFGAWLSCDSPTSSDDEITAQLVKINGLVLNSATDYPVENAIIKIAGVSPEIVEMTDSLGQYSIELTVTASMDLNVIAFKESYVPDTTLVLAVPGRTIEVPAFRLSPTEETPNTSSEAASIMLLSQSAQSIGVHESGAAETAKLIFEVQDSSGSPVDLNHGVELTLSIGSGPGGGEFIFPTAVRTSDQGLASVYVTSGTKAGVVQIIAEARVAEKVIRSKPVAMAIHGGLPDQNHFSLAADVINIPGYNIFGVTDLITAFVGDRYGNPVKEGTAVYFTTTGGIIQGSAATNELGQAHVNLVTAEPKPQHPVLGAGFATVTASTVDDAQQAILSEAIVLFSGLPMISIEPMAFNIPNGGSQQFSYTVCDQNFNPLAAGTHISVTVEGEFVEARGSIDKTLQDTQDRFWTHFSFSLADANADTVVAKTIYIKVNASGPNGSAALEISGISY
ncbi:MAG: Ig-like domain-containing protein [Candidatus Zhuqueibacterota bacterium]